MTLYSLPGFLDPRYIEKPLPFWEWAKQFNNSIAGKNILMGYSLGGRLAMHALIDNPSQWKAAILISAHPGLPQEQRSGRLEHDQRWAKRFLTDPWEQVMEDWNRQPVFSNVIQRNEADYSRERLAEMLDTWSLGRQDSLKAHIESLDLPILWIAGERDEKYRELAKTMNLDNIWIAPRAGHRVPWEQKEAFDEQVSAFMGVG